MALPQLDRPTIAISIPRDQVVEFCLRWKIIELAFFGSVLREDFRPDSDVDVLVNYPPDWGHGLFDWLWIRDELEAILGRKVDLVSRPGIERSRNPYRGKAILGSARVFYAS